MLDESRRKSLHWRKIHGHIFDVCSSSSWGSARALQRSQPVHLESHLVVSCDIKVVTVRVNSETLKSLHSISTTDYDAANDLGLGFQDTLASDLSSLLDNKELADVIVEVC